MNPRPYQHRGLASIYAGWQTDDVLMYSDPTGGGKTEIFCEVIKNHTATGKPAILLAHRTELITQAHGKIKKRSIPAGIIKAKYPKEYHFPTQVASIHTVSRRADLPYTDCSQDVLIVIDESHHVQEDNTYGAFLLKYPHAKVLMVTATPYRLSGKGFENIVPGKKTKLIVNSQFHELVEDGWLVSIKYHIGSLPDLSAVQVVRGEYDEEQAVKVMKTCPIVESYLENFKGKQGIVFCINVQHSKDTAQAYRDAGVPAEHVDGDTPDDERTDIIERYRQGVTLVLTNVNIFTEGTDLPVCVFTQLAKPSKSLSFIKQAIGRSTRPEADLVDRFATAEERKAAIAASSKPYGHVLDNTGAWREHGFPEDVIDWHYYFKGWKRQKKVDENPNMIEIPIYEIEDPATGARRTTRNLKELEGMILVEVTKEIRESVKRDRHMDAFYKFYNIAKAAKNMADKGQWSYFSFKEFCLQRKIEITNPMWMELKKILCDDVENRVQAQCDVWKSAGIRRIAGDAPEIKEIRRLGMRESFLRAEMVKYKTEWARNAVAVE